MRNLKRAQITSALTIVSLLLFCGYNIHNSIHRFNGIVGMTKKNGSGCYCHDPIPTPEVAVWVSGPDTLMAGEQGTYAISIATDSIVTAGFNVAAGVGSLGVLDPLGTYWYEDELTHAEPRLLNERGRISWLFSYTAPDSPSVETVDTIYSVANATNKDTMATEADKWNFGENFAVHILHPTSADESVEEGGLPTEFQLFQNYPNPFNPLTRISYSLPEQSNVSLNIYDVVGEAVSTVVAGVQEAGVHEVSWSGTNNLGIPVATGAYFYTLDATGISGRTFSGLKKILYLR